MEADLVDQQELADAQWLAKQLDKKDKSEDQLEFLGAICDRFDQVTNIILENYEKGKQTIVLTSYKVLVVDKELNVKTSMDLYTAIRWVQNLYSQTSHKFEDVVKMYTEEQGA